MPSLIVIETGASLHVRDSPRWIGGIWECGDQRFTDPDMTLYQVAPGQPVVWPDAPAECFWLDVGSFFDRFGQKAVITSTTWPLVDGIVRSMGARKYIDLKHDDLPQLVDAFVAKNILTESEKATVLAQKTTEYERYIKGLPQPAEVGA